MECEGEKKTSETNYILGRINALAGVKDNSLVF